MISYAQNFEDVMLARAFRGRADGFYIDVGACFPDAESVTRHFYDLGWSGVNVEPMPEPFSRLAAERTRDVNLQMALADREGEITIFEGASVGESSAVRPGPDARSHVVPCTTLAELCRRYATRAIDFLKIDVEGLEEIVVTHGDWHAYRPAIVVIEVTEPWSTVRRPDAQRVGEFLSGVHYREVYFDGLNAFYVAEEMAHLASHFSYPPNVLDGFIIAPHARALAGEQGARAEAHTLATRLAALRNQMAAVEHQAAMDVSQWRAAHAEAVARVQSAEARAWNAEARMRHVEAAFTAIQSSRSWRLTAPLRALGQRIRAHEHANPAGTLGAVRSSPGDAARSSDLAADSLRDASGTAGRVAEMPGGMGTAAAPATRTPGPIFRAPRGSSTSGASVKRPTRLGPIVRSATARTLRGAVRIAKRTRLFERAAPAVRERFPGLWSRVKTFLHAHPLPPPIASATLRRMHSSVSHGFQLLPAARAADRDLPLSGSVIEALTSADIADLIAQEIARQRAS